jgi:hypothetical protein
VIVNRMFHPEETYTDDEGEHVVPALIVWLIVCPDHECYTTVTVMERDLDTLQPETLMNWVECLMSMAGIDMREHGCDHSIPGLPVPA